MRRAAYNRGLDVLGAEFETREVDQTFDISTPDTMVLGAEAARVPLADSPLGKMFVPAQKKKRAILIQINNAAQLAEKEKGDEGAFAAKVLPDLVEQQVYQTAGDKLITAMQGLGVDATVKVIDATSWTLDEDDLGAARYAATGFFSAGALGVLGYLWLRKK